MRTQNDKLPIARRLKNGRLFYSKDELACAALSQPFGIGI